MSDLSATDREIIAKVFAEQKARLRLAFVRGDETMLIAALTEIGAAIDGLPGWVEQEPHQRGPTREQLEYRAKRFGVLMGQCAAEGCERPVALGGDLYCAAHVPRTRYAPRLQVVKPDDGPKGAA